MQEKKYGSYVRLILNELNTEASKNDGPKRLKEYLKYAKQVSEKKDKQEDNILHSSKPVYSLMEKQKNSKSEGLFFDSVLEEMVYNELRKLDYDLDTQVGNSSYPLWLSPISVIIQMLVPGIPKSHSLSPSASMFRGN